MMKTLYTNLKKTTLGLTWSDVCRKMTVWRAAPTDVPPECAKYDSYFNSVDIEPLYEAYTRLVREGYNHATSFRLSPDYIPVPGQAILTAYNNVHPVKDPYEDYVSEDGTYLIPVSWEMYSTIRVSGCKNLAEAIDYAMEHQDEIPITEGKYIDCSFKLDTESDLILAQSYEDVSDYVLEKPAEAKERER